MTEAVQTTFLHACARCHGPDGGGITGVSPDIRRGTHRTSTEWIEFLRDPKGVTSHSRMVSHQGLSDDEVKEMATYLADLLPKI